MLSLREALILKGKKDPKPTPWKVTQAMIDAAHKHYSFPACAGQNNWFDKKEGVKTIVYTEDDAVCIDLHPMIESSPESTQDYVSRFCSANGLKH